MALNTFRSNTFASNTFLPATFRGGSSVAAGTTTVEPELRGAPPWRDTPWARLYFQEPIYPRIDAIPIVPRAQPESLGGPPQPGSPFFQIYFQPEFPVNIQKPPTPPAQGTPAYFEGQHGPAMPGAPWVGAGPAALTPQPGPTPPPGPPPPPPGPSAPTHVLPFVPRVVWGTKPRSHAGGRMATEAKGHISGDKETDASSGEDNRLRRHTEIVADIINALLRNGLIKPSAVANYTLGYNPAVTSNWAGTAPGDIATALDRIAAALAALGHKP